VPSDVTPTDSAFLDDLRSFLWQSPSPFHAASHVTRRAQTAGFTQVDAPTSEPGQWVLQRDGAVIAWRTPPSPASVRVIGAHTDSPNLRLRPRPDRNGFGYRQLGVEVYGGALWNSWLDRDLGLSGRVAVSGRNGSSELIPFLFHEPLLRIPQLAIHLDRTVNEGLKLNPQQHLAPLFALHDQNEFSFVEWLAEKIGVQAQQIVSFEAMTHDLTPPTLLGADNSLFASARIDNLVSCHSAASALLNCQEPTNGQVQVVCLFDHEEVGSATATGAAGPLLLNLLEVLFGGRQQWFSAAPDSILLSADAAHATHPNYPDRHDNEHHIRLDGGPVLKHNVNARYATDVRTASYVREIASEISLPLQDFVSRNDIPCGSTIGPFAASTLGIPTVDCGIPQLSMHSARELCAAQEPIRFAQLLTAFFECPDPVAR